MAFQLTIAEGKGKGQTFSFDESDVTIGRGSENVVVLNDAGVSRTHARIEKSGAMFLLLDNGSSNGTELNGVVIQRETELRSGDRIGVGPVMFEFEGPSAEASAAAPLDAATRITTADKLKRSQETRVVALPAGKVSGEARTVAPRAGGARPPQGEVMQKLGALPLPVKIGAGVAAALLLMALVRQAVTTSERHGQACPEVVSVDEDMSGFSFGHGEVDVDCGNQAQFGFNVPPKTKALFKYVPAHVSLPSELELRLNGKHLAWAPVAASRGEAQVVQLPAELLSADGRNVVSFAESQKGKEWSVGRVRTEMLAITPGDLKTAREQYERGRRKLEERRVSPRNLYDAWKYFVAARRYLEGLSPKPPLYDEVAQLIKDCERDLDKDCSRLLFSAARFEKYGQDDRGQQVYRELLLHFPGDDPSSCRKKAQENIVSISSTDNE